MHGEEIEIVSGLRPLISPNVSGDFCFILIPTEFLGKSNLNLRYSEANLRLLVDKLRLENGGNKDVVLC